MRILEVVARQRALHDGVEVLLIFAILGLVLIALLDIKSQRRKVR